MLVDLYLSNLVLIKEAKINFGEGLSVISGETGSGKSVLIKSIAQLMGEKTDKDLIGKFKDNAIIEATLKLPEKYKNYFFEEYGIEKSDYYVLTKEISLEGRSVSRINMRTAPISLISEMMNCVIEMQTQNSVNLLLNKNYYLNLLDCYSNKDLSEFKSKLKNDIENFKKIEKKIESYSISDEELNRKLDLLNFQINEIESLDLKNFDIDLINQEYLKISKIKDIIRYLNLTKEDLFLNSYSSIDTLSKARSQIESVSSYDPKLTKINEILESIYYNLEDVKYEIDSYLDSEFYDEEKLLYLNEKIESFELLKRKYGKDKESILNYLKQIKEEKNELENLESLLIKLTKEKEFIKNSIVTNAEVLTNCRKISAENFEKEISSKLKELNFLNNDVKFVFSKKILL